MNKYIKFLNILVNTRGKIEVNTSLSLRPIKNT